MMAPIIRGTSVVPTISGRAISKKISRDHAWLAPESTIVELEMVALFGLVGSFESTDVLLRQNG